MPFDLDAALKAGAQPAQIADFLAHSAGFDVDKARAAGASDDQIIGFLKDHDRAKPSEGVVTPEGLSVGPEAMPTAAQAANFKKDMATAPILGPIVRGVAQAQNSVANTADLVSKKAGDTIRSGIDPDALNAPTTAGDMRAQWQAGNYGKALLDAPGAALEAAPQLAGAVGAGALGTAVGGPVGGAAALGLYGAGTQGGDIAKARAANNGRTDPNLTDAAIGLGSAAGLNMLPGVAGPLGGLERSALNAGLVGVGQKILKHGAADAVQAAGYDAASSAGTQAGLHIDPTDLATQAIMGATTRAGIGGFRGAADKVAGPPPEMLAAKWNALAPEDQQRLMYARSAAELAQNVDNTAVDRDPGDTKFSVAARTAAADLYGKAGSLIDSRVKQGVLSSDDAQAAHDVLSNAKNQQRALTPDDLSSLDSLPLGTDDRNILSDAARQMNMLSDAGVVNRNTSSVPGMVGGIVGKVAGGAAGALVGHPLLGLAAGSKIGSAIATDTARRLGLTTPMLLADASKAGAMMDAAGVPMPDTKAGLLSAIQDSKDAIATQAQLMGLDPSSYTLSKAEKLAQQRAAAAASDRAITGNPPDPIPVNTPIPANGPGQPANTNAAPSGLRMDTPSDVRLAMAADAAPAPPQPASTDPVDIAKARVRASQPEPIDGPGYSIRGRTDASRVPGNPLTELVPATPPSNPNGSALPSWQYRLGQDLSQALQASGQAKPVNSAQEAATSLAALTREGHIPPEIAHALMNHQGAVVWGIYNQLRNEALLRHGIDRRTLAAQGLHFNDFNPVAAQAAE